MASYFGVVGSLMSVMPEHFALAYRVFTLSRIKQMINFRSVPLQIVHPTPTTMTEYLATVTQSAASPLPGEPSNIIEAFPMRRAGVITATTYPAIHDAETNGFFGLAIDSLPVILRFPVGLGILLLLAFLFLLRAYFSQKKRAIELEHRSEVAEKAVVDVNGQLTSTKATVADLKNQLIMAKEMYSSATDQLKVAADENTALAKKWKEACEELRQEKEKCKDLREDNGRLRDGYLHMTTVAIKLLWFFLFACRSLKFGTQNLARLKTGNDQLRSNSKDLAAALTRANSQAEQNYKSLDAKYGSMSQHVMDLKEAKAAAELNCRSAQSEVARVNTELRLAKSAAEYAQTEANNAESKRLELHKQLNTLDIEKNALIDGLREDLRSQKSDSDAEINRLEAKVDETVDQYNDLADRYAKSQDENDLLQKQVSELNKQIDRLHVDQGKSEDLQQQVEQLNEENQSLQSIKVAAEDQMGTLKKVHNELHCQITNMQSKHEIELRETSNKLVAANAKVVDLQAELSSMADLQEALENGKAEMASLEFELTSLNNAFVEMEKDRNRHENCSEQFKQDWLTACDQRVDAESALTAAQADSELLKAHMVSEKENYQEELDKLGRTLANFTTSETERVEQTVAAKLESLLATKTQQDEIELEQAFSKYQKSTLNKAENIISSLSNQLANHVHSSDLLEDTIKSLREEIQDLKLQIAASQSIDRGHDQAIESIDAHHGAAEDAQPGTSDPSLDEFSTEGVSSLDPIALGSDQTQAQETAAQEADKVAPGHDESESMVKDTPRQNAVPTGPDVISAQETAAQEVDIVAPDQGSNHTVEKCIEGTPVSSQMRPSDEHSSTSIEVAAPEAAKPAAFVPGSHNGFNPYGHHGSHNKDGVKKRGYRGGQSFKRSRSSRGSSSLAKKAVRRVQSTAESTANGDCMQLGDIIEEDDDSAEDDDDELPGYDEEDDHAHQENDDQHDEERNGHQFGEPKDESGRDGEADEGDVVDGIARGDDHTEALQDIGEERDDETWPAATQEGSGQTPQASDVGADAANLGSESSKTPRSRKRLRKKTPKPANESTVILASSMLEPESSPFGFPNFILQAEERRKAARVARATPSEYLNKLKQDSAKSSRHIVDHHHSKFFVMDLALSYVEALQEDSPVKRYFNPEDPDSGVPTFEAAARLGEKVEKMLTLLPDLRNDIAAFFCWFVLWDEDAFPLSKLVDSVLHSVDDTTIVIKALQTLSLTPQQALYMISKAPVANGKGGAKDLMLKAGYSKDEVNGFCRDLDWGLLQPEPPIKVPKPHKLPEASKASKGPKKARTGSGKPSHGPRQLSHAPTNGTPSSGLGTSQYALGAMPSGFRNVARPYGSQNPRHAPPQSVVQPQGSSHGQIFVPNQQPHRFATPGFVPSIPIDSPFHQGGSVAYGFGGQLNSNGLQGGQPSLPFRSNGQFPGFYPQQPVFGQTSQPGHHPSAWIAPVQPTGNHAQVVPPQPGSGNAAPRTHFPCGEAPQG